MPRKRVSQTSLEYWKKREDEARRIYLEQEKNYDEEISRIYNRMLKDVQLQINGFFGRYASSEGISIAEAKQRASKMDVADFAEKAKKYVLDKDFSEEANEALKLYNLTMKVNRLELLKANIGLEMCAGFDEMQKYFDQILVDRVTDEIERQSGILGETIVTNAKMAKSLVGASFNNASFSDRIWMYQGMLRSELSSLLEQGIVQGKHANVLAGHLEKRFGVSKFSAQRLMRTEMARVQTEAQKQSFEQIGYKQYIFIAEHDSRTCPVCAALDGMIIDITKMMPGTNASPMHPMCRCSTAAYMDRGQFEKMVARSQISDKDNDELPTFGERPKRTGARVRRPLRGEEPSDHTIENCKTVEDVEKLLRSHSDWYYEETINGKLIRSIDGMNLTGCDLQCAKEVYKSQELIFSKYPWLKGQLCSINVGELPHMTDANCLFGLGHGGVTLNKKSFSNYERLSKESQKAVEQGWHPNGTNVQGIVLHEFGHAIDDLFSYTYKLAGTTQKGRVKTFSSYIRPKTMKACGLKSDYYTIKNNVSEYATKDSLEWFAECFTEYMVMGEKARPIALECGKQIEKAIETLKNGGTYK